MKWDRKNKNKLYRILQEKRKFQSDEEWRGFCLKFGIIAVERDDGTYRSKWMKEGTMVGCYLYPQFTIPADRKNRIIIRDSERGKESGLSIPKDVAEKFLVVGVP